MEWNAQEDKVIFDKDMAKGFAAEAAIQDAAWLTPFENPAITGVAELIRASAAWAGAIDRLLNGDRCRGWFS